MKLNNKKKIILGSIIGILLGSLVSVTYAFFTFSKTSNNNSQLVAGDIYMRYKESTTTINIHDMMPRSTKPNEYFEFTVEGTNTTENKDIIYDINIIHGDDYDDGDNDDSNDKVRIRDEFLRFTLEADLADGEGMHEIISNKKYSDFSNGLRMWVYQINKNTTEKVTHTYRLYVWIDSSIKIGNNDQDYTTSEWNNLYASVKVNVTGDFNDKKIYRELTGADKVLASIKSKTTCNPSTAVVETATLVPNLSGQPLSDCVSFATSSMGISSNAEAEAFCQGTGEVYENTFQGWLDNGEFPSEFITYFEEHNIITTSTEIIYDEDGAIYLNGSNDCINFNYVWWSGNMWRITAIYDDGSMKLVTENNITSIFFGDNEIYYNKETEAKSNIFHWLNEDFLDTLYNHGTDVIDTTKYWNATMPANTKIATKPLEDEATMIPTTVSPVGLLNSYEYYKSNQNAFDSNGFTTSYGSGYLDLNQNSWLLNPYSATHPFYVWIMDSYGNGGYVHALNQYGCRPSIYLKPGILFSGNGTKDSPYRLPYDYDSD